jgi:hypothetical protein
METKGVSPVVSRRGGGKPKWYKSSNFKPDYTAWLTIHYISWRIIR